MQQARMVGGPQKLNQMENRCDVASKSLAKVRIEIRQPGTIHHDIQCALQTFTNLWSDPKPRLADVAVNDCDALGDEIRESVAKPFLQLIEDRRLLKYFLETPLCRRGSLAADEQVNFADLWNLAQQLCEPDFADEAGYADQQNVLARQGFANRQGSCP